MGNYTARTDGPTSQAGGANPYSGVIAQPVGHPSPQGRPESGAEEPEVTKRLPAHVGRRYLGALRLAVRVQPEDAVSGGPCGERFLGEPQGEGAGVNGVEAGEAGLDEGGADA